MNNLDQEFCQRVLSIPFLGLGLSVDVYSPNLLNLFRTLQARGISVGYLEIFQAHLDALQTVRRHLPRVQMNYHAEGLWLTQPDWETSSAATVRLEQVAQDTDCLEACWINQECATKEILGYPFGTYVPPLFTWDSARLTAHQVWEAQKALDWFHRGRSIKPLLLLEVPPLTYFGIGDLSCAEYFKVITRHAPCGLVLDLGHIWTVYRYTGAWKTQSLEEFFDSFLGHFPLERVVQIHVAGLACHQQISLDFGADQRLSPPPWIDAHAAPIPFELLVWLEKTMQNSRLSSLKGVALEVDTKEIPVICHELEQVRCRLQNILEQPGERSLTAPISLREGRPLVTEVDDKEWVHALRNKLSTQYAHYVSLLTGNTKVPFEVDIPGLFDGRFGIRVFATQYVPYEILHWGGDIVEMFPRSCEILRNDGVQLERFVRYWFEEAGGARDLFYDFFLLKVNRFVEFFQSVVPDQKAVASQEAETLVEGYAVACREVVLAEEPG